MIFGYYQKLKPISNIAKASSENTILFSYLPQCQSNNQTNKINIKPVEINQFFTVR